jgi:hypothetical protein
VQGDSPQGRGARAVRKHQAQTAARLNDFRFWIADFGLGSILPEFSAQSEIQNLKSKMGPSREI